MSLRNPVRNRMNSVGPTVSESPKPKSKSEPLRRESRRLVLMFDGTGNKRLHLSNVARMFEAIDDSIPDAYKPIDDTSKTKDCKSSDKPAYSKSVPCGTCRQPMREPEPDRPKATANEAHSMFVPGVPCGTCHQLVLEPELQPRQLVKYIKGVGTDFLGRLSGLRFGYGLSANVIAGYVWLSNNHIEGDEIFVFGFSRGAFSARSLVSLVHRCGGVLRKALKSTGDRLELKEDNPVVEKAYAMYRAYVQTTDLKGDAIKNKPALHDDYRNKRDAFEDHIKNGNSDPKVNYEIHRVEVTVKMLGVWDTVGALGGIRKTGIKLIDDRRFSNTQYQFHNQGLSCIVKNAYHALAIDENRKDFSPTLWEAQTQENDEVKQVWFVGSHCNVGGGADMDDLDDPDDLWQYSYVWMQKHAEKHGLRFYWTYDSPATRKVAPDAQGNPIRTRRVSLRKPEDSYSLFLGGIYKKMFNRFYREVVPVDAKTGKCNRAKLHWSVVERIKVTQDDINTANQDRTTQHPFDLYRPPSLFGNGFALKTPEAQFTIPSDSWDMIEIHKLDENDKVISTTKWSIETDDVGPSLPYPLELKECSCHVPEARSPTKKTMCQNIMGLLP